MKIFSSFFKQNFSWYRLKTPQIRQDENWNFCKYAPLEVCWEKFSPSRADDVRTELLKLQITSPGCESRSARSRHVSGMDCDGDGIVCLDLDHNTESLDRGVSSHLTPYTAPLVTGHPALYSGHLTSASWHSAFCSAVCRSCCSLFTIGQRFTAELPGLQVSGQYAACGHQWLIMSEPCHRDIHRSRRILVRSMAQFVHLYILRFSHMMRKCINKSWALNYLPGGLFVVRFTSIGARCPWWDPWHWDWTRIRRGEFSGVMTTTSILMRSQFHIPFVPRLQPGS